MNSAKKLISVNFFNAYKIFSYPHQPIKYFSTIRNINHQLVQKFKNSNVNKHLYFKSSFSTSPNRLAIPPLLWLIFKPVTKLGAIIAGRGFRKWWASLPHFKRTIFIEHLKRNKIRYFIIAGGFTVTSTTWVIVHIKETPITNRKRFIMFNTEQLYEIEKLEKDQVISILSLVFINFIINFKI
jgi:hypothetical protein